MSIGPTAPGGPAGQRSAVDQYVQDPQLAGRVGDDAVDLLAGGDVQGHGDYAPAGDIFDLFSAFFQFGRGPGCYHHVHTLPGQFQRDRLADAAAATAYERVLVLQSEVHRAVSSVAVECRLKMGLNAGRILHNGSSGGNFAARRIKTGEFKI